jgi:putative ABC transport system permease protein
MLLRVLGKSLIKRKGRIAIAIISVIMGAAMASALLTVSWQVEEKIAEELTKFGPNLVLFPKSDDIKISIGDVDLGTVTKQEFIKESDISIVEDMKYSKNVRGIRGVAPYLFVLADVNDDSTVVIAGTWFDQVKRVNTWWEVDGKWIDDRNDTVNSMIGITVAEKLNLIKGEKYTIDYTITQRDDEENITIIKKSHTFNVLGIVKAGSEDDDRIFVNLDVLQEITNRTDDISVIQVTAICNKCSTDVIAEEIEEKLPNIDAKSVGQVEKAQMDLLNKINRMMLLITIIALLASALGVMTTMTTSVVERTKEIGMMKAIGAEDRKIAALFLSEAIIIGILGGLIGYIIGIVIAQNIGESVFQSPITPILIVLPLILLLSIGVTILSSILPVRRALRIEPAEVIRTV